MIRMLDFDSIGEWGAELTKALHGILHASFEKRLRNANPRNAWSAYDFLYQLPDLDDLIDGALPWLRSITIAGYHGSRLTDAELASVQKRGLRPLEAKSRRNRLVRVLSAHRRWTEVEAQLDEVIRRHSFREGGAHLALARRELVSGDYYKHNLRFGSEFDQQVARNLLGEEEVQLLAQYGEYRVLKFGIPGSRALDAANALAGGVEADRAIERIPNLVNQVLSSWCFWRLHPSAEVRASHCSMMFVEPVHAEWLEDIETISG